MSLVLTQRPATTYQGQAIRHNAVGNPMVYKFTRKDYITATVANSAGNLRVTYVGDLTSVIAPGASLYFRSDNGVYNGYYTVSTITYSAPDTTITFSGGYVSAATTGFINLTTRLNYKASIQVISTAALIGTILVSPDSKGDIIVDVSKVLISDLKGSTVFNYNTALQTQPELFKEFYIRYAELWIGFSGSYTQDLINLYAVYGSRQIGSKYNGFLNEYVSLSVIVNDKPKFLVTFPPKMWRSLPFNIAAIFDHSYATDFFFQIQRLDSSGALISTDQTITSNISGRVVTCTPEAINAIPSNCTSINIRTNRVTQSGISNYLNIPIEEPCKDPVVLRWVNSLGGVSWWCFENNHEYVYEYENGKKVKRLVLFAENLTIDQWEGINELNSPKQTYQTPFTELTSSVKGTSKTIGAEVTMYNFIGCEIEISGQGNDAGTLFLNSSHNHGFSYVNDDVVFVNAFYYASPYQSDGFYLRDINTNALIPYSVPTFFKKAWRVNTPLSVTVIANEQTTKTKQEKHSISITIELPEVITV